jgi:predicted secreted Zn-dependent protease
MVLAIAVALAGCGGASAPTRPSAPATSGPTAAETAIQTAPTAPTPEATATPTITSDQTIPNATMVYYDVTGATAQEVRTQLNLLGPLSKDGRRYDAMTEWFISWNWPGYGTSPCNLNAVTVSYDMKVEFPHWVEPANPDPGLVGQWTAYMSALALHEKGHVDYLVDHYQAVATAVKRATCGTADAAATAALQPIRQHDIDYDAATRHGATQGATFP